MVRQLTPKTSLENLKREAKRWLKALRANDPDARSRLERALPKTPANPGLRNVQHALARELGFEGWTALKAHLEARSAGRMHPALAELLEAAGRGNAVRVAAVLDEHPGLLNERGELPGNTGARTALHFGVGHADVVRTLLERGADPNIRDDGDDAMPLHFAAERGDLEVVRLLVERGADTVGEGTMHELNVLGWSVCWDYVHHVEVARFLLEHGARHTIHTAVALGDVAALHAIAARSPQEIERPMDSTNHRRRPLHLAVVKQQPEALAALLELGADVEARDAAGMTPLDRAALDGETSMAEALIAHGARLELPAAVALERPADIERLLRDDPAALRPGNRWGGLIVRAAARGSSRVIETLIRLGASPDATEDPAAAIDETEGYTALHAAAMTGNVGAIEVLLAHGANVHARDSKYGGTPAGWADHFGRKEALALLGGPPDEPDPGDERGLPATVEWFLENACPDHHVRGGPDHAMAAATAMRILASQPEIARASLTTAVVCGDLEEVERRLAARPEAAREKRSVAGPSRSGVGGSGDRFKKRLGPKNWEPLLFLCFTRLPIPAARDNAVAIARALLDRGADPNSFFMAGDSRYTPLVGAIGEGEEHRPPHPRRDDLVRLLLARGAEPYDQQVVYDLHFKADVSWFLELIHARSIELGREADWDDPAWSMFAMGHYGNGARWHLEAAIRRNDVDLARWCLEHGADPNAPPARDERLPQGSLHELALRRGSAEIAELLVQHGARAARFRASDDERFADACLRLDVAAARELLRAHPEYLTSTEAMFRATRLDRVEAVSLLLDLGVSPDVEDARKQRPLHVAGYEDAVGVVRLLIDRGAAIDPREASWGNTPLDCAVWSGSARTIELLSRHSRDVFNLVHTGQVARLRELLAAEPGLAKVAHDGSTPLMALPDDEARAVEIVELFLAHGADPSVRDKEGLTAADYAEKRALTDAARLLGV